MLAAVQATVERLIARWYLMRISAHGIFFISPKNDNYLLGAKLKNETPVL